MADFDFDLAVKFALEKLGFLQDFRLKSKQYDAIKSIVTHSNDTLVVLPTGYGKSLVYQCLPLIFDFKNSIASAESEKTREKSTVLIISPLNSVMLDQVQKLQAKGMGVCIWKANNTEDISSHNSLQYIYAHPEVFVNKKIKKILKKPEFQRKIKALVVDEAHLVIDWKNFRPAYSQLDVLSSIFPKKPIVALTATATKKRKAEITTALGMINAIIVEESPNRPNIYYSSSRRKDTGDDRLDEILLPLTKELFEKRMDFPLTLIYGSLETISTCYYFFSNELGDKQYEPEDSPKVAVNRMFSMYHAQYPDHERERIVNDLVAGRSKLRILFVTVAFGLGIDLPNIRRIIHIGVPCTIEEYLQEAGRAGRDGHFATAHVFYNSYDISVARKHLSDEMRSYVQVQQCKRKAILTHFGHLMPPLAIEHNCCDIHKEVCCCDDCVCLAACNVTAEDKDNTNIPDTSSQNTHQPLNVEQMTRLREELHSFRLSLPGTGRTCVGSTSLVTGVSLELLEQVAQNASTFSSIEDLSKRLPFFSHEHALSIWDILKKYHT